MCEQWEAKASRYLAVLKADCYGTRSPPQLAWAGRASRTPMTHPALRRAPLAPRLAGLALCVATSFVPAAQAAKRVAVSVGDVNVSLDAGATGEGVPELGRALRAALNDELSRVTGLRPMKRALIVSATLTRLSSERRDERSKASATITLALRRADDQVLFAELRGRASVEEASGNLASLRHAALQGAVHGALQGLPEVVEHSR